MKISIFGSTGFIGSRFCEMYPDDVLPVPRDEYITEEPSQVLYLISTTHNYGTWETNIETNLNHLLKVLNYHDNGDVFNFISSWFVYGDVPLPAYEHMQPNPRGGNYNLTKLWAEQLVQDYCGENGIPWKIFRLANVFGKGDRFSNKKNALQYLINEMKHDRDIELYNDGMFYRDYIHVDSVCRMLYEGMRKLPPCRIYNVGSGRSILFC
jgi:nucleoside-diphosphate-sugar epimerase